MLIDQIRQIATSFKDKIVEHRRHLHAHPELSFCEYKTAAFIKDRLDEMGIPWQAMADTGVVGLLKGEQTSERVIALRADMDALPITEANTIPYCSKNTGVMHACGHDVHTSSLLGTAKILQSIRASFGGTVKLIFQPGEEKLPGGASLMIREGVLKNPVPEVVIGQHVSPFIEAGKIGIRMGKFMASMDDILVTVRGKGGHGAQPNRNVDPVMISAHMLVSLQQIVSRMADPTLATVLSFGKVVANGAINVIPDEVTMEGTFRTLDEDWRLKAHARMKKMAEGIAESMGGSCDFSIRKGYPFLINEEKITKQATLFAEDYLGKENIEETDLWMASEDFAYYSHELPSCFYLLGVGNKAKGIASSLHTATFDIDEDMLPVSAGLMAYIAVRALGN